MELNDSLVPFIHDEGKLNESDSIVTTCHRAACLTVCPNLKNRIRQSLRSTRIILSATGSISVLEKAIERKICDVAIIDIERTDQWPASIFLQFDEAAADFPVIILCSKPQDVLNHRRKARYAFDIFPYDSIEDPRFLSLVYASVFRAEVLAELSPREISNHSQSYPAAAK